MTRALRIRSTFRLHSHKEAQKAQTSSENPLCVLCFFVALSFQHLKLRLDHIA